MQQEIEDTILQMVSDDANGVTTERICRFTRKTPQELGDIFERLIQEGKLLGFAGLWMAPDKYREAGEKFCTALKEIHEANPSASAIDGRQAVVASGFPWSGKQLDRILAKLSADGLIEIYPNGLSLKSFLIQPTLRQRTLLDRVVAHLELETINTPNPQQIAQALGIPRQAIEEILRLGCRASEVIQVSEVVFYTPKQIEALKRKVAEFAQGRPFSANDLRDALESTRKYTQPLLDYLDESGFTVKEGSTRRLI